MRYQITITKLPFKFTTLVVLFQIQRSSGKAFKRYEFLRRCVKKKKFHFSSEMFFVKIIVDFHLKSSWLLFQKPSSGRNVNEAMHFLIWFATLNNNFLTYIADKKINFDQQNRNQSFYLHKYGRLFDNW